MSHSDETLMNIFTQIDKDGSGSLDQQELQTMLVNKFKFEERRAAQIAQDILAKDDPDKDGKITFEEFKAIVNKQ